MIERRTLAIGDIHGCAAALAALLHAIDPTPLDTLVILGDAIDRGPDSRDVLEQLMDLRSHCNLVTLLGNHEEMLLAALEGLSELRFWLQFGGQEALASYGCNAGPDLRPIDVRQVIPSAHLQFIRSWGDCLNAVGHFFAHGYYEPLRPLHDQPWNSLRWCAVPSSPAPHCSGKVAILGHTAQTSGEILDLGFLKCIDTYCHGGGWLTALEVESGRVWQANREGQMRG